jgi:hypothetical protein
MAMELKFVPATPKREEVPVVIGGVYRFGKHVAYYILNSRPGGSVQLNSVSGTALRDGLFETLDDVRRFLNDPVSGWTYIPDAVLHIPKEDA